MRTFLMAVLGVIAMGVLLIAYGVINPRTVTTEPLQFWRGADARVSLSEVASPEMTPQFELRCEAGQRAVVRQVGGAASARCVDDAGLGDSPRAVRTSLVYPATEERIVTRVRPAATQPVARRSVRVDRKRDWGKTAMVIGGSSAAGAGIGGLIGGQKGALIGAAIGGGAGTLYEVKH